MAGAPGFSPEPDGTAAEGHPFDGLAVGLGPAVEPGLERGVGEVVAHRQKGDRVVGGVGGRDDQVVEIAVEVETGSIDEAAPVGEQQEKLVDGRGGALAARRGA